MYDVVVRMMGVSGHTNAGGGERGDQRRLIRLEDLINATLPIVSFQRLRARV